MPDEVLIGRLLGDRVRLGSEAVKELYDQGYFGRPVKDGLDLSLVEAVYLLDRSRIQVFQSGRELDFRRLFEQSSAAEKGFEFRYVVYKDLRERGYYIQPGQPDFRVYPRGGHPGKTPAEFYVSVISERIPVAISDLMDPIRLAGQMRKRLMLAVVDEEGDITYYEAREKSMVGRMGQEEKGGVATLLEDRVVLWDPGASEKLHHHGFYGKPLGGRLQLSLVESAYLLEKGLIELVDRSGKPISIQEFQEQAARIETDFAMKYRVYRDLREHKLVVKTGFKFGTHFRVYKQVESPQKVPHSEYLVHTVSRSHIFHLPVISRAVRLAHSVRKQMIFAYSDGDVRYMEIRRLKP
ncbi:MAG: tRNA-intron lyase [Methanosarcinales archaeon]|nr:tRNA-intron lyase [Methanosarcinales archaeon]